MRILQVAPPWFAVPPSRYGGTELVVSVLTEALVRAGHEVTLLASGGSRTAARLRTVYEQPPSDAIGDTVLELGHVLAIDDLEAFDVVHDHTLLGSALTAARGTVRVVHTLHGQFTDAVRPVLARLGHTVELVAISHDQAARAPEVPIRAVVHNGLDLSRYGPGEGTRGDSLVFVGRSSPEKGPEAAIEVARRTGRPLKMAVKITEPAEHEYWRDVVAPRLDQADVEVFLDVDHATKLSLLRAAHAMVLPLHWDEPFGLVMAEAGACGIPVVVFGRGAAAEIVDDRVTGRVVDPAEGIAGLVRAVDEIGHIDPAACRSRIAERFSAEALVAGYLDVYRQITTGPPRTIDLTDALDGPASRGVTPTTGAAR